MRWYWIDRFIEFESGRYAKAVKNVSLAEEHLHDHFPGYPIMPPSLIIEGVAQTAGLLVGEYNQFKMKVVLAKVPRAVFYHEAKPGDTLIYTATIDAIHPHGAVVHATSHLGDKLQAELELVFAHLRSDVGGRELFEAGTLTHMMRILRAYEVGVDAGGTPLREPDEEA